MEKLLSAMLIILVTSSAFAGPVVSEGPGPSFSFFSNSTCDSEQGHGYVVATGMIRNEKDCNDIMKRNNLENSEVGSWTGKPWAGICLSPISSRMTFQKACYQVVELLKSH